MYDLQRTLVIGGKPTARQQWLINGCCEMTQTLGVTLHDGVTCRHIHTADRRYLDQHGGETLISAWTQYGHSVTAFRLGSTGHGSESVPPAPPIR
jgi:Xaa-Pro aminopeptidase